MIKTIGNLIKTKTQEAALIICQLQLFCLVQTYKPRMSLEELDTQILLKCSQNPSSFWQGVLTDVN